MIYLIRHGEPDFGVSGQVCLGRKDLPLSPRGRQQAGLLRSYFSDIPLSGVYHSRLTRCQQTAERLAGDRLVFPVNDIEEVNMGEWEGLSFEDIRRLYPKLYELRGLDPGNVTPPGGESLGAAGIRFAAALFALLQQTEGELVVVAHAGINRMLLGRLLGMNAWQSLQIAQPYGCVNRLQWDNKALKIHEIGALPY